MSSFEIMCFPWQRAPMSPVSRGKFVLQAESLDIKEDTEEGDGTVAITISLLLYDYFEFTTQVLKTTSIALL
jgi:hypothetical protein